MPFSVRWNPKRRNSGNRERRGIMARLAARVRKFLLILCIVLLMPYAVTLAISGNPMGTARRDTVSGGRRVYLEGQGGYVDAEEYLIGVVAVQIPMEYEMEAIKAQAIIARTWLYRQMDDGGQISISELRQNAGNGSGGAFSAADPEYSEEEHFLEYYEKAKTAAAETAGQVICYDGKLIEPLFHRASAGKTRSGGAGYPYLQSVDSSFDVEAEGYLTVLEWTPEEFAALAAAGAETAGSGAAGGKGAAWISAKSSGKNTSQTVAESGDTARTAAENKGTGQTDTEGGGTDWSGPGADGGTVRSAAAGGSAADQIMQTLQLVSRDSSGYVAEYQIGSHIYAGDEVREIFGLPSADFIFKNREGNIQAVCKGQGHGLGMSQYGANHLALEGLSAEEILKYYYHGVTVEVQDEAYAD